MQYIFNDLDSSEQYGMFLMVDKIDMENKLPLKDCRIYGISWFSEEKYQTWTAPGCNYYQYPFGRYIKKVIEENLISLKEKI